MARWRPSTEFQIWLWYCPASKNFAGLYYH